MLVGHHTVVNQWESVPHQCGATHPLQIMTQTHNTPTRDGIAELTRRDFLVGSGLAAAAAYSTAGTPVAEYVHRRPEAVALADRLLTAPELLTPGEERYAEWWTDPERAALVTHLRTLVPALASTDVAVRSFVAHEGTDAPHYVESAAFAPVPSWLWNAVTTATGSWLRATRKTPVDATRRFVDGTYSVEWRSTTGDDSDDVVRVDFRDGHALFTAVYGPRKATVTPLTAAAWYSECVCGRLAASG